MTLHAGVHAVVTLHAGVHAVVTLHAGVHAVVTLHVGVHAVMKLHVGALWSMPGCSSDAWGTMSVCWLEEEGVTAYGQPDRFGYLG